MQGLFPPSSSVSGVRCSAAARITAARAFTVLQSGGLMTPMTPEELPCQALADKGKPAVMAAHQLCHPGMLDLIPKYGGIAIQELRVDNWHGRTLVDLNLIQSFGVMVMGIRPAGERAFQFVPPALTVLHKGDTLVVAGRADAVRKLEP